ncbi:MAG: isopentenyl phosphate kinase family protein [Methanocorpusculum parvum]|nr:isopentenyl phosphate kinase family protein [Methanocorpusculum parvum]
MTVIIKLGGSVITDKEKPGVVRREVIAELAEAIASSATPSVIVHGAGSLGHPEAKAYGIAEGVTRDNACGVPITHEAVSRLNTEVVAALRHAGVEAVSFHPFSCALAENGRLVFCGEEQIHALLALGIVPVLHGDVVCDRVRGACIVSGDQIVPFLAKKLGADKIGIVTATGGVLANGEIIPEITRESVSAVHFSTADAADVTGGMQGKVDELLSLAESGIPSHIIKPKMLKAFLAGNPCGGTLVK